MAFLSPNEKDKIKDHHIDPALYTDSPDDRKKLKSTQMTPNFTGWTPLISRTNEQLINFNVTPSSKFLNNILLNSASHNSILQNDIDYSNGLNLTPFLNHNINFTAGAGATNGSNGPTGPGSTSLTPFHDKTLFLSDFLMDSPTRNVTPLKDMTITPSKFKISDKKPFFQDPKSAKKRSIHELDTPNRQPHKLSISVKAADSTDDEVEDDDDDLPPKSKLLQTPSKVLNTQFVTPKPTQTSSPSTVILSSGTKSPSESNKHVPNSPTPRNPKFLVQMDKENESKPVMGVFSEAKPTRPVKKPFGVKKDTKPVDRSNSRFGADIQVNNMRFKTSNKAQMQAGMNKFQIVLSDGSRTRRGRKSKKLEPKKAKKEVTIETQSHANYTRPQSNTQPIPHAMPHPIPQPVIPNDHSLHKDSSLLSGSNNSMTNVSHGTEHTSFEFGLSSTPNGKFLLDKMFEKPSPQSQQLLNQVLSQQYQHTTNMPPPKHQPLNPQVMMMMSTPNHPSVYSPNDIEDEGNVSLSTFYHYDKKMKN